MRTAGVVCGELYVVYCVCMCVCVIFFFRILINLSNLVRSVLDVKISIEKEIKHFWTI